MILLLFILLPLAGGLLAWYAERLNRNAPRWVSLIFLSVMFALVCGLWIRDIAAGPAVLFAGMDIPWVPELGISFHLEMDGLSLLLAALSVFLGITAVAASWEEIRERVGLFHLNLLWIVAGIIGVFLAADLFLFYFFWELMLVPMYFIISLWGHERRMFAAVKFFLFTQAGGLFMLAAILGLYVVHGRSTGIYTFSYHELLGTSMDPATEAWLMAGFLFAFLVKLPVVPLHTWLPDAHTEAPTAGSVILAGLLLKTGAYGLIRFAVPLFPHAARFFAPAALVLGAAGILYGAVLAFAQSDLKRLVAYTSVSHMGFVLLGIFSWNEIALQGTVMQMLCHGLGTGALFILAGALQERLHTRDMNRMGGLWSVAPRMGAAALFMALAALGLPGLGSFIGEFLVLLGAYRVNPVIAAVATVGFITAVIYALWIMQRVFFGENERALRIPDLSGRETAVTVAVMAALLWLGLYPQPVFRTSEKALAVILEPRPGPHHAVGFRGEAENPLVEGTCSEREISEKCGEKQ